MYKFILFIAFYIASLNNVFGQSVSGSVLDKNDKTIIQRATVKLVNTSDSATLHTVTSDRLGNFLIENVQPGSYSLIVTSIGYEILNRSITVSEGNVDAGVLYIPKAVKVLNEVTIKAEVPPVKQKQDTVEYSANAFKVNPDANVEDLIRKMPGVTVDKTGAVTAQGEAVKKVTIDGKDFFGDDATAALRNLPAEIIDKIQVFDRLSDQAQFTGFDDGNSQKAINVVTKVNMRNGQYGRIYAGYGTDDRYSAGGNVSFFKGDRKLSVVGLVNNINQQNFSSQDLLGVTNSGQRGGGGGGNRGGGGSSGNRGGGQGGGGSFGNTNNYLVGQQNGISKTNAFGINFSDVWAKKLTVSGSYFFNNSSNTNNQQLNRQYFLSNNSSQFYNENSLSNSNNYNNRINMRIEYKIDSFNTLMITPSLNFQNNKSFSSFTGINSYSPSNIISSSNNKTNTHTSGNNLSNNLLYRHAFRKKGRTISLNLTTGYNERNGETYLQSFNNYFLSGTNADDSIQQFSDRISNTYNLSANLVYTEPIGKKSQLQFNYNPSYSKSKSDQETFQYDDIGKKYTLFDTVLSNKYDNIYTTQNGGISFRTGDKDNQFSVGASYQYSKLSGDQQFPQVENIERTFSNILPNLMWRKKLSAKSNLRIFYRSSVNQPSISQLQNVVDNTNPLQLTTGNPELKQQFNNTLATRFSFTNTLKGNSFFANIFMQTADNYIANTTIIPTSDTVVNNFFVNKGVQISLPVNLSGYISLRSFFTYAMPVKFIKSNLNLNAGLIYSKIPGLINDVPNTSNLYTYNAGAVIASNVSEYIDFTLSYSGNFSVVKNSIQPQLNNNYYNQLAGLQLNLLSKKGWFFQNDVTNQSYSGLTDGFNQSFWLWNMGAGKKFFNKQQGELKLSVFDLLKQNRSIIRTTTETYIEDLQSQVLRQYFMLTFTYKLKNFGTAAARSSNNNNRPPENRGF